VTVSQPGSLARFWLWAAIGVVAIFGTFSYAGAFVWPLCGAGIGLLAARSFSRVGALAASVVGLAGPALAVAFSSPWPLVGAIPIALALALVHSRREAAVLAGALGIAFLVLLALRSTEVMAAIIFAPVLLVLGALAVGRPQREAAGAISGAGLALFAVGAPEAGIPLTLAGAVLMLALGMRRRRLAVSGA